MTANIDPVNLTPSGALDPAPASRGRRADTSGAFGAALANALSTEAPSQALAPAPPPELSANIAAAARAWDALASAGHAVVFNRAEGGRISIELHDEDGNELESLSGTALFRLLDEHGGE